MLFWFFSLTLDKIEKNILQLESMTDEMMNINVWYILIVLQETSRDIATFLLFLFSRLLAVNLFH